MIVDGNIRMFIAKSLVFYSEYVEGDGQELSDEIILPSYHLKNLMEDFKDDEMLLVDITNRDKELSYMVAISTPHNEDKNVVFVPQWILDLISYEDESIITIRKSAIENIPVATKIAIRPLDPIAFDTDILSCFEKTLINLHSIKEGIIIPVRLPEFDMTIYAQIDKVEPAPISRIINGEVDVEFINEFTFNVPVIPNTFKEEEPIDGLSWGADPLESKKSKDSVTAIQPQLSAEERRQQVRDAWLKKF